MKLELLKAGLQKLVDNNEQAAEALLAITEINEIQQRVGSNDFYSGDCYVLYADTLVDILTTETYDTYDRLQQKAVAINHDVRFNDYEKECRGHLGLDYAPLSVIQLGYEIVSSLYNDNENQQ